MRWRGPNLEDVWAHPTAGPDLHALPPVSWNSGLGFNLDGKVKDTDFTSPDGEKGIDNNYYRAAGCWVSYRGAPYKSQRGIGINGYMRDGLYTILIVLSGRQDPMNDDEATLAFYQSKDKIVKDNQGQVAHDASFAILPTSRTQSLVKVSVKNGVIETTSPQELRLRDEAWNASIPDQLLLTGGKLRFKIKEDGGLEGYIGGYQSWKALYKKQAIPARDTETNQGLDLPSFYYALERYADADPDPVTGKNRRISAAYRLRAVPAFVLTPDYGKPVTVAQYFDPANQPRLAQNNAPRPVRRPGAGRLYASAVLVALAAGVPGCRPPRRLDGQRRDRGDLGPGGRPASAAGPVVGMRRLTESQYRRSVADIFGREIKITGRFEPEVRRDGLIAIGSGEASISAGGMEQSYAMGSSIADQVTGPELRKTLVACTPANPKAADTACAQNFIGHYGRLLFRRPLSPAELKASVALADKVAVQTKDFYTGLDESLGGMLTSPYFLFRVEKAGGPEAGGLVKVDDYTKASRLSFLLWNAPPDDALLTAAQKGELSTREGLQRQADRLTASPRLGDGVAAFFDDMLQMDKFASQTKDSQRFPKYSQVLADDARQQTLKTLVDLLVTKNGDYRDIFTTRDTFMTRTLALVYKVPYLSKDKWAPYRFADDSGRAGVITQISFLSLFSHPAESSPTKRGVALNEIFLCQPTPPPPNNVDFTAVNPDGPNKAKTVRLRLEAHVTNPVCAGCHTLVDPPGVALERFDTLGQYREREEGQLIDVHSQIGGKPFDGAVGLGQVLHDNPRASACVAKNLYATGTGRSGKGGATARRSMT